MATLIEAGPAPALQVNGGAAGDAEPLHMRILDTVNAWFERSQIRAELSELTDDQLSDAGLDPVVTRLEALQPFWRPLHLSRVDD